MLYAPVWNISATKILTKSELKLVLAELARKAPRSPGTRMNLVIVRLACCCGLRVSEIAGLQIADVRTEGARPHLRIRKEVAKGRRSRIVPLWWDAGTLADLAAWKSVRLEQGSAPGGCFVSAPGRSQTDTFSRHTLRKRFKTACKPLGGERVARLTIHHGRHTFVSLALAGGRSLAEVRDAAGHANVSITSCYLHVAHEDNASIGTLFQ
jgi:integrase